MSPQPVIAMEGLLAAGLVAYETSLVVQMLMLGEIGRLSKGLAALVALERLLLCVGAEVHG